MPLQKLPVNGSGDPNHERRVRESINGILTHQFDDSRVQTPAEKLAGITPVNYAYPPSELGPRYGIVADGTTDQSTEILSVINAIGAGVYTIPYNVKFDRKTVCTGMPSDALIFDLSMVNSFADPGFRIKRIGILSSDVAADDTGWYVESGHHPGITLNNFRTAGTGSAGRGTSSIDWACGAYALAGAEQGGDRFGATISFQKSISGNFWGFNLISQAPWLSLQSDYETWRQGEVITATTYRVYGSNHYISTSTGTTGASPPTHSAGTVSDGGVDWTWLDFVGRTLLNIDEYNRIQVGSNSVGSQIIHQTNILDPGGGQFLAEYYAANASKNALLKLWPTNSGGTASAQPYLQAQDGVGLRFMKTTGGDAARISDTQGLYVGLECLQFDTAADGDTTPTVLGRRKLYLSNSGATSITTLDDSVDDQEIQLLFTNGNTTLVHSAGFTLQGSVNVTPTAWSVVCMSKVRSAVSNRWVEVSRSIK